MTQEKFWLPLMIGVLLGVGVFGLYNEWQTIDVQSRLDARDHTDLINGQTAETSKRDKEYLTNKTDEIFSILQENYYLTGKLEKESMDERALQSFVNALEDPYTVYLDNKQNADLSEALEGSNNFEGIGAYISKKDQGILIEQLVKGGPAFKAGVLPLDIIVDVNGSGLQHTDVNEAVEMLRGPAGSIATLTIFRTSGETDEIVTLDVVRENITIPSVESEVFLYEGKNLGYLVIHTFGEDTEKLVRKEILSLKEKNIDGLIVDVRGNGGGLLDVSIQVISHFVPKGQTIVQTRYSDGTEVIIPSFGYGEFEELPVVVLIDFFTASASEILALALAEQRDAVLVGSQTIGKGSIQTIQELGDGSSLKYTIGRRYSPDNTQIDRVGIVPDIDVAFERVEEDTEADNQLDVAKETLFDILSGESN